MFKDMVVSEQIMQGFEQSPLNLNSTNQNFPSIYVHVLTTGSWPIPSVPVCNLPNQILQGCENFKTFYLRQYSGRRLAWQTHLGTAELKCDFKKGKKELLVPTYQMCILMLYNDEEKFSYQAIQEITRIPDLELKRHLLSLAHPKCKILLKEPNVREIEDNHTFSWNDNYTNPLYRVKVNLLSASVAEEKAVEKAEVPESVMEARNNRVEAAVVRIMKARKTLEHNQLVVEVSKQLSARFPVEPTFIKKRIESLIEREYLERDKNDRRLYHYLA
eukprot:TRINITY_DN692_c0_g1_i5.p1 TRINITY_DN692_c0_g1~~TRINITY_DN692_c0_g1_i5.p1  ORF type:complete len:274 (+),score=67.22 TRINITY_DN692_c0_g1_i5:36-857(+)